jgi:hypothetical protein
MSTASLRLRRQQDRQATIKEQWVQLEVGGILLLVPLANLYRVVDRQAIGSDLQLSHEGQPVPIIDADRQIFGKSTFKAETIAIAILQDRFSLNSTSSIGTLAGLPIVGKPLLCRVNDESFKPLPASISFCHIDRFIPDSGMPQYHLNVESLLAALA